MNALHVLRYGYELWLFVTYTCFRFHVQGLANSWPLSRSENVPQPYLTPRGYRGVTSGIWNTLSHTLHVIFFQP